MNTPKPFKPFKPFTPEKLHELLLKCRKGATAAFGPRELAAVVGAVGGTVTETVTLVPLFDGEEGVTNHWFSDAAEATTLRAAYEAAPSPASLGTGAPVAEQLYVERLEVLPIEEGNSWSKAAFASRAYMGNVAYAVSVPGAPVITVAPDRHDLQGNNRRLPVARPRNRITLYGLWARLAETDLERLVCDRLGMEPHRPGAKRVLDNTGTCGCCFENMKREGNGRAALVLHGYRRPGDGAVHGRCYGVGYQPFEVSVEATQDYLTDVLIPQHEKAERNLAHLKSGEVKTLTVGYGRHPQTIDPTHIQWEYYLRCATDEAQREVTRARGTREAYERLVENWVPRPLPVEGEYQKDWFYHGQRAAK